MNSRTDEQLLVTENLSFMDFIRYPDMTIPVNAVTFLTGESGTGKSTLLRLFNNSLSPSSGTVYYRGTDILSIDPIAVRRSILLAGQAVFLFDDTIAANFAHFFSYRDETVPDPSFIMECLSICRADFSPEAQCATLSGGERQRVYLALFLAMESDILMLDEPTSALDGATGRQVMENICSFCRDRGRTLVMVSHDESLVNRFSDHTIVLVRKENA